MTFETLLPVFIVLASLIPGLAIFGIPDKNVGLRTAINLGGAVIKLVLVAYLIVGVVGNETFFETRFELLPGLDLALRADPLSLLFIILSATLWLVTTIYAIGYLDHDHNRSRFFGFFSLCVSSTMGIAMAGNLLTFLIFYEMLTICTYPLVVHNGNDKALEGGRTYLAYTLIGGAALLLAVIWIYSLTGPVEFTTGGALGDIAEGNRDALRIMFLLFMIGVGVKAAIFPMHGWLPRAMVAPAPVSALLHAVAVVKAGAFGVVRIVSDVYGAELARDLGVLQILLVFASLTIVIGSMLAIIQDDLKRRLAYSTVSQVSYIVLGIALFGPIGAIGGLLHLVHQGVMKITLFFCAGTIAETVGVYRISQMNGIGRRMPLTMATFTVGALGMIGVPPIAGFISKWYLGLGALDVNSDWVVGVLVMSSLLNAGYFLPILYRAWFMPPDGEWPKDYKFGRWETNWMLLMPPVVTAIFSVLLGLLASLPFGLLELVEFIVAWGYGL